MSKIRIGSAWGSHMRRPRSGLVCEDGTRTKQSFKEECDINNIVRKFQADGQLPYNVKENPQYGDYSAVPSYQEAMNIVRDAEDRFNALPAMLRKRFDNDPGQFIEFVNNPDNVNTLKEFKMLDLSEAPKPIKRLTKNKPVDSKNQQVPAVGEVPKS